MATVYILKNRSAGMETTVRVYKKSSYQQAYNFIADMAEKHLKHPEPGIHNIALQWTEPGTGIKWWLERWETE